MTLWHGSVVLLSVLLLVFLVYREYKRLNHSNRIIRIFTSVFAVTALCLSILPLSYSTTLVYGNAIVLTGGYSQDSLNRFLSDNPNCCTLFSYNQAINDSFVYYTGDMQTLSDSLENYNQVDVFGYGFSDDENNQLKKTSFIFHPAPPPSGIKSSSWTEELHSGEPLLIQGEFYAPLSRNPKLTLSIASTIIDSLLPDSSSGTFMFQTIPRHMERATYLLRLYDGQNLIETNEIPVEVVPAKPIRILILSSAPDFETRFLKDWLYASGNSLVVRTTISRNKIDYQYLNSTRISADRLTEKLMQSFDLLVLDAGSLNSLSPNEVQVLNTAIESGRTGVIVQADQPLPSNNIVSSGISLSAARSGTQILQAKLEDYGVLLPEIAVTDASFLRFSTPMNPLVTSTSSILAASILRGSGEIVFTSLNNSYFWSLAGKKNEYNSYWRTLMTAALPLNKSKMNAGFGTEIPRVNYPAKVIVQFPGILNPTLSIDSVRIPLRQNIVLKNEWRGTWWPVKTGWVKLSSATADTSTWKYVYPESSHQIQEAWKKIAATTTSVKLAKKDINEPINQMTVVDTPVPVTIYYLIFLLCAGYLWLEKKLVGEV